MPHECVEVEESMFTVKFIEHQERTLDNVIEKFDAEDEPSFPKHPASGYNHPSLYGERFMAELHKLKEESEARAAA